MSDVDDVCYVVRLTMDLPVIDGGTATVFTSAIRAVGDDMEGNGRRSIVYLDDGLRFYVNLPRSEVMGRLTRHTDNRDSLIGIYRKLERIDQSGDCGRYLRDSVMLMRVALGLDA